MQSRPISHTSLFRVPSCFYQLNGFISGRFSSLLPAIILGFLLAGCAGQAAFREGQELIAQNKMEQGLQKLQEAVIQNPTDARFKSIFLQTRDRTLQTYLVQAARMFEKGDFAQANQLYQQVLNIDNNNDRAKAGLRAIINAQRHEMLLKEASALIEKNDIPAAQAKLRTVLTEDPQQAQALALKQTLNERTEGVPLESQLAAVYKKPISIEFKEATLKQIFEIIARTSGLNFVFDKDVRQDQKTQIFLKNTTIESAVYYTLISNQLEQQILDRNTILIYPNTPAKQKDYQEIVVKSFFLTNADAKTVGNSIRSILKTRDVVVDEKLNMIVLRDNLETVKQAEKLIAVHDVAESEVMLEVEILEVKRTDLLELGIQLPGTLTLTALPASTLTLNNLRNINSNTLGAGIDPVTINAKKTSGNTNLLANPSIRVRNREKAKILIGDRVPSLTSTTTASGFLAQTVNFLEVGLKLEVEPLIHLDNDVSIKVNLEVSNIVNTFTTPSSTTFQIGTRSANTVLRLKDGETQVLAGLISDEERYNSSKTPGLGEIPILGRLFGTGSDDSMKTEIVLSITPRLIRNVQRPDAASTEFRIGTEGNSRQRPDVGGLTSPVMPPGSRPVSPPAPRANGNPGNPGNTSPGNPDSNTSNPVNPGNSGNSGNSVNPGNSGNPGNANTSGIIGAPPALPIESPGDGGIGSAPPSMATQLRFLGQQRVNAGDTFLVQLTLSSDQNISSLPITVGFDSRILQVVGVSEGIFLRQGGAQTTFSSRIDPNGQILINATRAGLGPANQPGAVANLTFRAISPLDETRLQILTVAPLAIGGRALTVPLPAPFIINIAQAAQ
jgi:general secretion pathway protein D